jgi:hypothetical protein
MNNILLYSYRRTLVALKKGGCIMIILKADVKGKFKVEYLKEYSLDQKRIKS